MIIVIVVGCLPLLSMMKINIQYCLLCSFRENHAKYIQIIFNSNSIIFSTLCARTFHSREIWKKKIIMNVHQIITITTSENYYYFWVCVCCRFLFREKNNKLGDCAISIYVVDEIWHMEYHNISIGTSKTTSISYIRWTTPTKHIITSPHTHLYKFQQHQQQKNHIYFASFTLVSYFISKNDEIQNK